MVDIGEAGPHWPLVDAGDGFEVDVVDALVLVAVDQVDERPADAFDGGNLQLHRPRADGDGRHALGNERLQCNTDRKSTRLNSSPLMRTSYAVFCLKKKN